MCEPQLWVTLIGCKLDDEITHGIEPNRLSPCAKHFVLPLRGFVPLTGLSVREFHYVSLKLQFGHVTYYR